MKLNRRALPAVACLALLLAGPAVGADELGHPVLRHYTPGEHLRGLPSQRVTQDVTGIMYFANGVDLLSFDGARWDDQRLPTESAGIRQFAQTADGTLYIAGASVLGYLRGSGPGAQFVSLVPELPPAARNIDELRCAVAIGQAVYFSDDEKILIWRGGHFSVVPFPAAAPWQGARLHRIGDTLYVTALERGFSRLVNDRLEVVSADPVLRENQIISVEAGAGGAWVLLTAEHGFFQLGADGRTAPLASETNRWLAGKRIFCALRLDDGSRVVAFSAASGDGGMRFGPDGRYAGPLDTSIGLAVKTIRGFFCDREGGLWVGTEAGAARLEWPSAVSLFDGRNGLGQGAVADVLRHDGVLYAATSEGYFRLEPGDENGRMARFERIAGTQNAPDFFERRGGGEPTGEALKRVPHFAQAKVGPVTRVREEAGPDGPVLWVCGVNGLARIEVAHVKETPAPFSALLHATGVQAGEQLPTKHAAVTFSFVAPRQRPTSPVTYQTRLDGLEDDWSDWSSDRERSFPSLSSGSYRFEVRARDAAGQMSSPAALAFEVLAPWWRRPWAIASGVLLAGGLLAGVVQLRTRALRLRATQLEAVVAERTTELAARNLELVRLHQLELDEKISARLAEEKARLEVLRYQLNPHFLFNTLASISASLPIGGSTARSMVERLAEFCRLTLHREDERDWTTLGEELRLLRTYLEIEKSRWGELLDVEIACDDALAAEQLPHFLLLPLVENALKYGRATSPDRVGLRLGARRAADGALVLEVANTGEWIEPTAKKSVASLGIGLDNLRERLVRYYPRAHRFAITHAAGWVTVTLHIFRPRAV